MLKEVSGNMTRKHLETCATHAVLMYNTRMRHVCSWLLHASTIIFWHWTLRLEERQHFESRFAMLEQQAADQVGFIGWILVRWFVGFPKASWRSAAEERIREMTARSEKLERDRCPRHVCGKSTRLNLWRCQGLCGTVRCVRNEWREQCFGGWRVSLSQISNIYPTASYSLVVYAACTPSAIAVCPRPAQLIWGLKDLWCQVADSFGTWVFQEVKCHGRGWYFLWPQATSVNPPQSIWQIWVVLSASHVLCMLYQGHELSAAQRQQQACSDQSQVADYPSKKSWQNDGPTWHPTVPGIEGILGAGGTTWWALKSQTLGLGTGATSEWPLNGVTGFSSPKNEDGEQMFQEVETQKLISMEGAEILLLHLILFHGFSMDFVDFFHLGRWRTLWATVGVVPSVFLVSVCFTYWKPSKRKICQRCSSYTARGYEV